MYMRCNQMPINVLKNFKWNLATWEFSEISSRPGHVKSRGFEFPHHFVSHPPTTHTQLRSGIAELTRKACLSHKLQTYTHRLRPLTVSRLVPTMAESRPAFPSPVAHSSHDALGRTGSNSSPLWEIETWFLLGSYQVFPWKPTAADSFHVFSIKCSTHPPLTRW